MYVVLNDKRIEVTGEVAEQQVAPFNPQVGAGGIEFVDSATHQVEEFRDFRGGLGMETQEKPSDRFYWSDGIETTKEGYLTLGPLVTTAGAFGVQPIKILDFNSVTYAFGNSVGKKWNTGTSAWDTADSGALASPTDALVVTDATATYLVVCNGTDVRYSSNGTSWSSLSTENVKYLTVFDKRLIGIDAAYKKMWYSPREDIDGTLSSFNLTGDYSTVTDLFTGRLLTSDEPCIYMLTDNGLFVVDFYTQTCYQTDIRYPPTTNAKAGMFWNSDLLVGTGSGISRMGGRTVTPWGPDQGDGLPTDYQGYVYDMVGLSHWAIIAIAGGTNDSILKRHESYGGWHQVYSSSSAIECIAWSPLYSPGRLWFGDGTNIKYVQFPDKTHNPTKVSGYTYAASGDIYLPVVSKLSSMPKVAVAIEAVTKALTSATKVTPYYIVNDDTSLTGADWTMMDTWETSPNVKSDFGSGLGVSFYEMCLKLHLERTSTTTITPIIKSIALKYLPLPATVISWTFTIEALGRKATEIITDLADARDASTLVNFSPDGDTKVSEHFVRIVTMPAKRWLDRYAAEKQFQVTVSEVVGG